MTLTEQQVEELRQWAWDQAPLQTIDTPECMFEKRPVRLEIGAEQRRLALDEMPDWVKNYGRYESTKNIIVVRAYLAEPRCCYANRPEHSAGVDLNCECAPLAEKRLL